MDIMLIIVVVVAVAYFFYKSFIAFSKEYQEEDEILEDITPIKEHKKSSKQKVIVLKNKDDLNKAQLQLDELYELELKTVDKKRYLKLNKQISELEHVIDTYLFENEYDTYKIIRADLKEYPLDAVSMILHCQMRENETIDRRIDALSYGISNTTSYSYIYGFCHIKNERRVFRLDRIKSIKNDDHTEISININEYLRNKYEESPFYKVDCLFNKYNDIFRVLFYMAKTDGSSLESELRIIKDTLIKLVGCESLSDTVIDDVMSNLRLPSFNAFKADVNNLAQSDDPTMNIFDIALSIVRNLSMYEEEPPSLAYIAKTYEKLITDDFGKSQSKTY